MKKAVVYVRGSKKEMQEILCRLYASEKGYNVIYTTSNIDDINLCDVVIATSVSRLSRDQLEYHKIVNKLKGKNITFESALEHDNANGLVSTAIELLR